MISRTLKKLLFVVSVVILLTAMITATAFAVDDTGVTINGGSLSVGAITFADFGDVTLDGQQKTTTATWNIADIIDSRGTGEGWNLSLTLTELDSGTHTIPTGSMTVATAPVVTLADGTSSPAGDISVVPVDTGLDGSTVKLITAEANEGMGSYHISDLTASLTIRADAYAGVYKTDATVALVTGP